MAFPKEFYKENITPGIERTSNPSGGVLLSAYADPLGYCEG